MKKTIKAQIFKGYITIILTIIVIVIVFLLYLFSTNKTNKDLLRMQANQNNSNEAIISHYEWLEDLNKSIQTGTEFTKTFDPNNCSFSLKVANIDINKLSSEFPLWTPKTDFDKLNKEIYSYLEIIKKPHEEIHILGEQILELSKTNKEESYSRYLIEIKPKVYFVIEGLTKINEIYKIQADAKAVKVEFLLENLARTFILLIITLIICAFLYANSISNKISQPIKKIAEWSKQLSTGIENLNFDNIDINNDEKNEVSIMCNSFNQMVKNIKESVNILKKVANGDMTSSVKIYSDGDSLGKSIHKLIESNNSMFFETTEIANIISNGAEQVSEANQALANNINIQSEAVTKTCSFINEIKDLSLNTTDKSKNISDIFIQIKTNIDKSNLKLKELVNSVDDIRITSEKIFYVAETIDNIAKQTNLLAINASIEASRAGEAGLGFVVIANKIQELSIKCSNSVKESKTLIDNAIGKTYIGEEISKKTSKTFNDITNEVNEVMEAINDITKLSSKQQIGIEEVYNEIQQISRSAIENSAVSQQVAALSEEMNSNGELLRQSMCRFILKNN